MAIESFWQFHRRIAIGAVIAATILPGAAGAASLNRMGTLWIAMLIPVWLTIPS